MCALYTLIGVLVAALIVTSIDALMPIGSGPISRFQYAPAEGAHVTAREAVYARLFTTGTISCPKQNEWAMTTPADKQLWRLAAQYRGYKPFGDEAWGCYVHTR